MDTPEPQPTPNQTPTQQAPPNPEPIPPTDANKKTPIKFTLLGLIVVLLALVSWLVWKAVSDSNDALDDANPQSTVPAPTNETETPAAVPDDWVEFDTGVYKFNYPDNEVEVTFSYMDFFGHDGPDETFKNIIAVNKGSNSEDTLFDISIQKNVDWASGISPIDGLDLEEAAKRSHEANKSDKNPNYEVKIGELEQIKLGTNTAYSFTTNIGFVTDYNNPTDGSGTLLGGATALRAYFVGSNSGDIVRIVVDDNDQLAKEILNTLTLR